MLTMCAVLDPRVPRHAMLYNSVYICDRLTMTLDDVAALATTTDENIDHYVNYLCEQCASSPTGIYYVLRIVYASRKVNNGYSTCTG